MTIDPRFDGAAREWIADGPTTAPSRAVGAALEQIADLEAGPVPWLRRRPSIVRSPLGLAMSAAAAIVIAVGVLAQVGGFPGFGGVHAGPSPTPSDTPAPTAAAVAPSPSPFSGACTLMTGAEAETVTGRFAGPPKPIESEVNGRSVCLIGDSGGEVLVRLSWVRTGGSAVFDTAAAATGTEVVEGLGDAAVFNPSTGELHILRGDSWASIVAHSLGKADAIALASVVLPRMSGGFSGACTLMTSQEAEALAGVFGGSGSRPVESEIGGQSICLIENAGGEILVRLIWVRTGGSAVFDAAAAKPGTEVVPALGDAAVFNPTTGELHVRRGDRCLIILAHSSGKGDAIAYANIAVPRM